MEQVTSAGTEALTSCDMELIAHPSSLVTSSTYLSSPRPGTCDGSFLEVWKNHLNWIIEDPISQEDGIKTKGAFCYHGMDFYHKISWTWTDRSDRIGRMPSLKEKTPPSFLHRVVPAGPSFASNIMQAYHVCPWTHLVRQVALLGRKPCSFMFLMTAQHLFRSRFTTTSASSLQEEWHR